MGATKRPEFWNSIPSDKDCEREGNQEEDKDSNTEDIGGERYMQALNTLPEDLCNHFWTRLRTIHNCKHGHRNSGNLPEPRNRTATEYSGKRRGELRGRNRQARSIMRAGQPI